MLNPTEILLLRHGETDWNVERRSQGHIGPGLNARGIEQARAAAHLLSSNGRRIDAIYASDLDRALETAQIVAESLGLPITTDERLRERSFGAWQGLLFTDLDRDYPERRTMWIANPLDSAAPGGESMREVARRIKSVMDALGERHPGQRVLVVTHGGPVGLLRCWKERAPVHEMFKMRPYNCEVTEIVWPLTIEFDGWL